MTDKTGTSYIFKKMTRSLVISSSYSDFGKNKVTFVTFNYDRSLEHFLYESLRNSFLSADEGEIVEQLRQIPILHVYGKIADLPWENGDGTPYLKVEHGASFSEYSFAYFENLKSNIHTIHERNDYDRSKMIEAISDAKRVFFLGFGYAQENLEILKIKASLTKKQKIYGTAFSSVDEEIQVFKESLGFDRENLYQKNGLPDSNNNPFIHRMDCLRLLRECL